MKRKPKRRKEPTLTGILCDEDVKDIIAFQSTTYKSPIFRHDVASLNSDHTHLIIHREQHSSVRSRTDDNDQCQQYEHMFSI